MGRPVLHDPATIVDCAIKLAAGGVDAITIGGIGRAVGVPSGSIYHRFGSRDGVLAATWLEATRGFQVGFLAGLGAAAPVPGLAAALHVTDWARTEPARARLLALYRVQDFGAARWPDPARAEARVLAAELESGLGHFSTVTFGDSGGEWRRRVTFALLDVPVAAVRRYLSAGVPPPPEVDDYVAAAVAAVLAPGRN
ncbi:MAG: TetR/AcrR family transcriptional regulator [Candidatus Dormibacteria bacterium]